ncbi:sugar transferase [Sphaerospermopsis aphanizomenoides BCCUSP55]|uniref:heterocyst development glycosyltransferase HepC n=1 Tax=Sphaerospermopsis aphanizomenoides TaxID=459663 RepID=UPI0019078C35|nr:heterocyst development glycosyltransferase HepC [Sphaerospermopsis aphanizomenoides]MBK1986700.1 sugar transferase [Sphaerospermopsis aphanizomenoides BCCUSP55]
MTTSIVPNLHSTTPKPHQNYHSQYCTLQWRRGQLLVKPPSDFQQPYLPSLDNEQLLVECLKNSPVNVVTIDPKLGYAALRFWADACQQANKPIFLSMACRNQFSTLSQPVLIVIQRLIDWILALSLLLLISPLMLGLIVIMRLQSFDLLFTYKWHIGERGKLFRAINFCTTRNNHSPRLGLWMRKYGLDNLPKLFNVLCGEMSLIKYRCWCLEDVIKLSLEIKEQQLNELPEVITAWQIETEYETARLS